VFILLQYSTLEENTLCGQDWSPILQEWLNVLYALQGTSPGASLFRVSRERMADAIICDVKMLAPDFQQAFTSA